MIFQKHCDEGLLIAYVDGELRRRVESRVARHLKSCWRCRGRLAELEGQAHAVAQALETQTFPGPGRIDQARRRFFGRLEAIETESKSRVRLRVPQLGQVRRSTISLAQIAAGLALCITGLTVWFTRGVSQPGATDVLAGIQAFESKLYASPTPVHQVFHVEVHEKRPQVRTLAGRLEVWAESGKDRFATRWEAPDGKLRFALWHPGTGDEYFFNAAVGEAATRRVATARRAVRFVDVSLDRLDLEQLESGFLHWLEDRRWRPISIASEVSAFVSQEGVVVEVDRLSATNASPAFRLSAHRTSGGRRVEVVVEFDADTYRPRVQLIRLETAEHAVELRLIPEQLEAILPGQLVEAVFEPDRHLRRRDQPQERVAVPFVDKDSLTSAMPKVNNDLVATQAELDQTQVEAHYVLHRTRACLGEPVEVAREPEGIIRIRGLVDTPDRKAELLAALAELDPLPFIQVDIKTVAEAWQQQSAPDSTAAPPLESGPPGPPEAQEQRQRSDTDSGFSIHAELIPYFEQLHRAAGGSQYSSSRDDTARSIAQFSSEALSSSRANLTEAWALRRLGEWYGHRASSSLPLRSRWLLEGMLRDHLNALRRDTSKLRMLTEPALLSVLKGDSSSSEAGRGDGATAKVTPDWVTACNDVFSIVGRSDAMVASLFAGAGMPIRPEYNSVASRRSAASDSKGVIADLLFSFPEIEAAIAELEGQLAKEFSGGKGAVSQ